MPDMRPPPSWMQRQQELLTIATRQLFFVGGAPRSGTTWLQHVLDSHPDVCCRGEGLFMQHLASPLEKVLDQRTQAITEKNSTILSHTTGFPLPTAEDADALIGTAILMAMRQQCAGRDYRAVGEKTPENVFFFPRLKRLFPGAKFIGMARDPRDVLASAWHFFHQLAPGQDEDAAKRNLVCNALPSLRSGLQRTLELIQECPADCTMVTYEDMLLDPARSAARMFRFLGVSDGAEVVAACVANTSFSAMSSRQSAAGPNRFFRKGVAGNWRSTFGPELNTLILSDLGDLFPAFGWQQ